MTVNAGYASIKDMLPPSGDVCSLGAIRPRLPTSGKTSPVSLKAPFDYADRKDHDSQLQSRCHLGTDAECKRGGQYRDGDQIAGRLVSEMAADALATFGLGSSVGLSSQIGNAPEPSRLPIGFDAVVQSSWALLQRELVRNLEALGFSPLSIRFPYTPESLPEPVRTAVEGVARATLGPLLIGVDLFTTIDLEMQLAGPVLTSIHDQSNEGPGISVDFPVEAATASSSAPVTGGESSVEIAWTLLFNLVHISSRPNVSVVKEASEPAAESAPVSGIRAPTPTEASSASASPEVSNVESRVLIDQTNVTMTAPGQVVLDSALLRTWFKLGLASSRLTWTSDGGLLDELLGAPVGESLIRTMMSDIATSAPVPLSPLFAFAGDVGPQVISAMDLPTMHVEHAVLPQPSGQAILSIGLNLGEDAVGTSRRCVSLSKMPISATAYRQGSWLQS